MARLHHLALRLLRDMVTCLPEFIIEHHDVCRGCALGKYSKTTFPSSDTRAVGILDFVYFDLRGSMSSASLKGFEYYAIFVDDFFKKTWIYFLKS